MRLFLWFLKAAFSLLRWTAGLLEAFFRGAEEHVSLSLDQPKPKKHSAPKEWREISVNKKDGTRLEQNRSGIKRVVNIKTGAVLVSNVDDLDEDNESATS